MKIIFYFNFIYIIANAPRLCPVLSSKLQKHEFHKKFQESEVFDMTKRLTHQLADADIISAATKKYGKRKGAEIARFAITFNNLLQTNDIDQWQIASDLDISVGAISGYRNGTVEPKLINLIAIADYFGVDCHYLMTGVKTEDASIARNLGISGKSIKRLQELNKKVKAQRKRGWTPVEDYEIGAVNLLLEDSDGGANILRNIYQYVFFDYDVFLSSKEIEQNGATTFDFTYSDSVTVTRHDNKEKQKPLLKLTVDDVRQCFLVRIQQDLGRLQDANAQQVK